MRHCYVLRVFTRDGQGGNPLGVVTDVSGLSDRIMQEVAAELGFSETVYIDWRSGGTPKVRIFTPRAELPFAGHPLVGAGWVLNVLGPTRVHTVECPAGEVSVHMDGERVLIEAPPAERPVREGRLAGALAGWVDPIDVRTVSLPMDYQIVQLSSPDAVALAEPAPVGHVMIWAWAGEDVKARFFAPDFGVPEDPATGSAAVGLASVLRASGRNSGAVTIFQGDEMGAPSSISLTWRDGTVALGGTVAHDATRELDA